MAWASLGLFLSATIALAFWAPSLSYWPEEWVLPIRDWVTLFFDWFGSVASGVTRTLSWLLAQPIALAEILLFRGVPAWDLGPLPWISVVAAIGILGHWLGGRRLVLFVVLSTAYLAVFNLWQDSMKTLGIVLVTVPLAAALGLFLGIWATRRARVERILTVFLDVMQATPHMAYLGPVVVLFGFGQVPSMLATLFFAMPPMARCTILGIRTVPSEVIEAGYMSGCTPRQLLWKVQLPSAHQTLLLGLNQVVMQTLAMVVIASLVGASGLGQKLLYSLQQLQIGKAVEQGVAITLIAIVLDRLSRAYMRRVPRRRHKGAPWNLRHPHLLCFLVVTGLTFLCAAFIPALSLLPKEWTFSYGGPINDGVRWVSKYLFDDIKPVRDWITIWLLLPIRDFYLWLPWPAVIGGLALVGWRLGGWRLALLPIGLFGLLLLSGFWTPLMLTIYLVTSCALLSVLIGVPLGVWAARRPTVARILMVICDTLQTFPSFIYLIPVIMLFQTSDLSNVIAMLFYATVPAIRYTYLGLVLVPKVTSEAVIAAGATARQKLWKADLPIALPEIMLGINQTIMMALAMVAITALIGSRDLGQEVYKALPGADIGRGLLAGLGIAFIGIIADRLIGTWAKKRKADLGIT